MSICCQLKVIPLEAHQLCKLHVAVVQHLLPVAKLVASAVQVVLARAKIAAQAFDLELEAVLVAARRVAHFAALVLERAQRCLHVREVAVTHGHTVACGLELGREALLRLIAADECAAVVVGVLRTRVRLAFERGRNLLALVVGLLPRVLEGIDQLLKVSLVLIRTVQIRLQLSLARLQHLDGLLELVHALAKLLSVALCNINSPGPPRGWRR